MQTEEEPQIEKIFEDIYVKAMDEVHPDLQKFIDFNFYQRNIDSGAFYSPESAQELTDFITLLQSFPTIGSSNPK